MRKSIYILLCLLSVAIGAEGAYVGRVFVDKNKNGRHDSGEKTLPNVMVSDGLQVVKTDAAGTFRLPGHEKQKFIFITTPSGYKTDNKYYIPIDETRPSYEFALQPYSEGFDKEGRHRFIQITDTEIFNTNNNDVWATDIRNYAANEKAAFIIHTGDICYEKGLRDHIELMNTANMGCPTFYCLGNHDLMKESVGEALFEQLYGPVFYSFEVGNTHYIVLPMLMGDGKPTYTKEDVYRWLKNDLRHVPLGKPVIVFCHDLLTQGDHFLYGINENETIDLNAHNLKAWVYGHRHTNFMRKQGTVHTICTAPANMGGVDHSIGAFRVVNVDKKGNVSSQLRYPYRDKYIEIASPGEDGYPVYVSGAMPLTVNTYCSDSPTREVTYSCFINGKKQYADRPLTQKTDWTWKDIIHLSQRPVGKEITIKVKATFRNGEKAEKEIRFTYGNRKPQVNLTEDWTNLLGNPEHKGMAKTSFNGPLRMAWTNNIGSNIFMTSPVVYKGNVYVATMDDNLQGKAFIYALNGQTGEVLWRYFLQNSVKNTIVVSDDIVFAQTIEGTLYAIKTTDGSLKWGKQLLVEKRPPLVEGLVIADGVLYAGSGTGLCAMNIQTGDPIWENKGWQQTEGSTATLTVGKGMLISSAQWKGLYGNDIETGETKWLIEKGNIKNRAASAVIDRNALYVSSRRALYIIDPVDGQVLVRKDYPFVIDATSTPLVTDQEIIFGTADYGLVAVDKETLEVKWQYETGDALVYTVPYMRQPSAAVETSPVLSDETVYFGASDGAFYGLDRKTGELRWKHSTGAPVFGSMALSGNTLIAVDLGGNIYAFVGHTEETTP